MKHKEHLIRKYLRPSKKMPTIWCPGCGIGIFMQALIRAIDRSGYGKDDVVMVSGIGCSSRIPIYLDFNTLHTTHGRALTFATGIKLARPHLKVITIMGDGDAVAIGGNHLIHAAKRNIDVSAFVINNQVYGMTGGQCSPTTAHGTRTTSSPYGNLESAFDISRLVEAAGAAMVGRATVYHTPLLDRLIDMALHKKGFAMVEVIAQCVTYSGRWLGLTSPADMMLWQRDNCVRVERAQEMTEEELADKIVIGVLSDRERPTYSHEYRKLFAELSKV
ncbi:MAG: 2-oxoacid:ferredoxin oxidoreductase subunit beta [Dehalococcoidia bacterium]|nr:2-oxoacid:ferredoxin oxidoreductase subunit beta [Dehalococcoidia bacterium]